MISKRRLIKYKEICQSLGVKLVIRPSSSKKNPSWRLSNSTIYLTDCSDLRYLDSAFCHEIAHVLCCLYGIYPTFHGINNCTPKQRLKAKLYHGITAERYVDKIGQELKKELKIGKHRYLKGYSQPWASTWYNNQIKLKLRKMEKSV